MDENTQLLALSVFFVAIGFFGSILLDGWAGILLVVIAVTSFFIASTIGLRFLATAGIPRRDTVCRECLEPTDS
ncbi:hypothetical protein EL22_28005 [Halostagnicola sp. A56]|nr:hypothetical protein EL22_28005 [Halostagnicola sp. A56]